MLFSKKIQFIGTAFVACFFMFANAALGQTTLFTSNGWAIIEKIDGTKVLVEKPDEITIQVVDTLTASATGFQGRTYSVFVKDGSASLSKDGATVDILTVPGATAAAPATTTVKDVVEKFRNPFQNHRTQSGGDESRRSRQSDAAASDTTSKSSKKGITFLKENVGLKGYYYPYFDWRKLSVSRQLFAHGFDVRGTVSLADWFQLQAGPHFNQGTESLLLHGELFDGIFTLSGGRDLMNNSGIWGFGFGTPEKKRVTLSTSFFFTKGEPVAQPTAANPFATVQPGRVVIEPFLGFRVAKKFQRQLYVGAGLVIVADGATQMKTASWGFYPSGMVRMRLNSFNDVAKVIRQF